MMKLNTRFTIEITIILGAGAAALTLVYFMI